MKEPITVNIRRSNGSGEKAGFESIRAASCADISGTGCGYPVR